MKKELDRRRLLKKELEELYRQKYRLQLRIDQINKELEEDIPEQISISEHALKRFKQRIQDLPIKVIKKILSDQTLLERYVKYGEGKYKLQTHPNVVAVVSNFKVVTVYSAFDPKIKLEILGKYMNYWIDQKIFRITNEELETPILTLRQFTRTFYH